MIKDRTRRILFTLCFFAFMLTVAAMARPAFAQCEDTKDADIVADIYDQIKADKGLAPQASHINIVSNNLVVKFVGWADSKKDHARIVEFANTSCVRMINVNAFADSPPPANSAMRGNACASGTKQCGDVCIPEADSCNITGKP